MASEAEMLESVSVTKIAGEALPVELQKLEGQLDLLPETNKHVDTTENIRGMDDVHTGTVNTATKGTVEIPEGDKFLDSLSAAKVAPEETCIEPKHSQIDDVKTREERVESKHGRIVNNKIEGKIVGTKLKMGGEESVKEEKVVDKHIDDQNGNGKNTEMECDKQVVGVSEVMLGSDKETSDNVMNKMDHGNNIETSMATKPEEACLENEENREPHEAIADIRLADVVEESPKEVEKQIEAIEKIVADENAERSTDISSGPKIEDGESNIGATEDKVDDKEIFKTIENNQNEISNHSKRSEKDVVEKSINTDDEAVILAASTESTETMTCVKEEMLVISQEESFEGKRKEEDLPADIDVVNENRNSTDKNVSLIEKTESADVEVPQKITQMDEEAVENKSKFSNDVSNAEALKNLTEANEVVEEDKEKIIEEACEKSNEGEIKVETIAKPSEADTNNVLEEACEMESKSVKHEENKKMKTIEGEVNKDIEPVDAKNNIEEKEQSEGKDDLELISKRTESKKHEEVPQKGEKNEEIKGDDEVKDENIAREKELKATVESPGSNQKKDELIELNDDFKDVNKGEDTELTKISSEHIKEKATDSFEEEELKETKGNTEMKPDEQVLDMKTEITLGQEKVGPKSGSKDIFNEQRKEVKDQTEIVEKMLTDDSISSEMDKENKNAEPSTNTSFTPEKDEENNIEVSEDKIDGKEISETAENKKTEIPICEERPEDSRKKELEKDKVEGSLSTDALTESAGTMTCVKEETPIKGQEASFDADNENEITTDENGPSIELKEKTKPVEIEVVEENEISEQKNVQYESKIPPNNPGDEHVTSPLAEEATKTEVKILDEVSKEKDEVLMEEEKRVEEACKDADGSTSQQTSDEQEIKTETLPKQESESVGHEATKTEVKILDEVSTSAGPERDIKEKDEVLMEEEKRVEEACKDADGSISQQTSDEQEITTETIQKLESESVRHDERKEMAKSREEILENDTEEAQASESIAHETIKINGSLKEDKTNELFNANNNIEKKLSSSEDEIKLILEKDESRENLERSLHVLSEEISSNVNNISLQTEENESEKLESGPEMKDEKDDNIDAKDNNMAKEELQTVADSPDTIQSTESTVLEPRSVTENLEVENETKKVKPLQLNGESANAGKSEDTEKHTTAEESFEEDFKDTETRGLRTSISHEPSEIIKSSMEDLEASPMNKDGELNNASDDNKMKLPESKALGNTLKEVEPEEKLEKSPEVSNGIEDHEIVAESSKASTTVKSTLEPKSEADKLVDEDGIKKDEPEKAQELVPASMEKTEPTISEEETVSEAVKDSEILESDLNSDSLQAAKASEEEKPSKEPEEENPFNEMIGGEVEKCILVSEASNKETIMGNKEITSHTSDSAYVTVAKEEISLQNEDSIAEFKAKEKISDDQSNVSTSTTLQDVELSNLETELEKYEDGKPLDDALKLVETSLCTDSKKAVTEEEIIQENLKEGAELEKAFSEQKQEALSQILEDDNTKDSRALKEEVFKLAEPDHNLDSASESVTEGQSREILPESGKSKIKENRSNSYEKKEITEDEEPKLVADNNKEENVNETTNEITLTQEVKDSTPVSSQYSEAADYREKTETKQTEAKEGNEVQDLSGGKPAEELEKEIKEGRLEESQGCHSKADDPTGTIVKEETPSASESQTGENVDQVPDNDRNHEENKNGASEKSEADEVKKTKILYDAVNDNHVQSPEKAAKTVATADCEHEENMNTVMEKLISHEEKEDAATEKSDADKVGETKITASEIINTKTHGNEEALEAGESPTVEAREHVATNNSENRGNKKFVVEPNPDVKSRTLETNNGTKTHKSEEAVETGESLAVEAREPSGTDISEHAEKEKLAVEPNPDEKSQTIETNNDKENKEDEKEMDKEESKLENEDNNEQYANTSTATKDFKSAESDQKLKCATDPALEDQSNEILPESDKSQIERKKDDNQDEAKDREELTPEPGNISDKNINETTTDIISTEKAKEESTSARKPEEQKVQESSIEPPCEESKGEVEEEITEESKDCYNKSEEAKETEEVAETGESLTMEMKDHVETIDRKHEENMSLVVEKPHCASSEIEIASDVIYEPKDQGINRLVSESPIVDKLEEIQSLSHEPAEKEIDETRESSTVEKNKASDDEISADQKLEYALESLPEGQGKQPLTDSDKSATAEISYEKDNQEAEKMEERKEEKPEIADNEEQHGNSSTKKVQEEVEKYENIGCIKEPVLDEHNVKELHALPSTGETTNEEKDSVPVYTKAVELEERKENEKPTIEDSTIERAANISNETQCEEPDKKYKEASCEDSQDHQRTPNAATTEKREGVRETGEVSNAIYEAKGLGDEVSGSKTLAKSSEVAEKEINETQEKPKEEDQEAAETVATIDCKLRENTNVVPKEQNPDDGSEKKVDSDEIFKIKDKGFGESAVDAMEEIDETRESSTVKKNRDEGDETITEGKISVGQKLECASESASEDQGTKLLLDPEKSQIAETSNEKQHQVVEKVMEEEKEQKRHTGDTEEQHATAIVKVQEEVEKVDIIEHIKEPVLEEEHVVNEVCQMPNLGETLNKKKDSSENSKVDEDSTTERDENINNEPPCEALDESLDKSQDYYKAPVDAILTAVKAETEVTNSDEPAETKVPSEKAAETDVVNSVIKEMSNQLAINGRDLREEEEGAMKISAEANIEESNKETVGTEKSSTLGKDEQVETINLEHAEEVCLAVEKQDANDVKEREEASDAIHKPEGQGNKVPVSQSQPSAMSSKVATKHIEEPHESTKGETEETSEVTNDYPENESDPDQKLVCADNNNQIRHGSEKREIAEISDDNEKKKAEKQKMEKEEPGLEAIENSKPVSSNATVQEETEQSADRENVKEPVVQEELEVNKLHELSNEEDSSPVSSSPIEGAEMKEKAETENLEVAGSEPKVASDANCDQGNKESACETSIGEKHDQIKATSSELVEKNRDTGVELITKYEKAEKNKEPKLETEDNKEQFAKSSSEKEIDSDFDSSAHAEAAELKETEKYKVSKDSTRDRAEEEKLQDMDMESPIEEKSQDCTTPATVTAETTSGEAKPNEKLVKAFGVDPDEKCLEATETNSQQGKEVEEDCVDMAPKLLINDAEKEGSILVEHGDESESKGKNLAFEKIDESNSQDAGDIDAVNAATGEKPNKDEIAETGISSNMVHETKEETVETGKIVTARNLDQVPTLDCEHGEETSSEVVNTSADEVNESNIMSDSNFTSNNCRIEESARKVLTSESVEKESIAMENPGEKAEETELASEIAYGPNDQTTANTNQKGEKPDSDKKDFKHITEDEINVNQKSIGHANETLHEFGKGHIEKTGGDKENGKEEKEMDEPKLEAEDEKVQYANEKIKTAIITEKAFEETAEAGRSLTMENKEQVTLINCKHEENNSVAVESLNANEVNDAKVTPDVANELLPESEESQIAQTSDENQNQEIKNKAKPELESEESIKAVVVTEKMHKDEGVDSEDTKEAIAETENHVDKVVALSIPGETINEEKDSAPETCEHAKTPGLIKKNETGDCKVEEHSVREKDESFAGKPEEQAQNTNVDPSAEEVKEQSKEEMKEESVDCNNKTEDATKTTVKERRSEEVKTEDSQKGKEVDSMKLNGTVESRNKGESKELRPAFKKAEEKLSTNDQDHGERQNMVTEKSDADQLEETKITSEEADETGKVSSVREMDWTTVNKIMVVQKSNADEAEVACNMFYGSRSQPTGESAGKCLPVENLNQVVDISETLKSATAEKPHADEVQEAEIASDAVYNTTASRGLEETAEKGKSTTSGKIDLVATLDSENAETESSVIGILNVNGVTEHKETAESAGKSVAAETGKSLTAEKVDEIATNNVVYVEENVVVVGKSNAEFDAVYKSKSQAIEESTGKYPMVDNDEVTTTNLDHKEKGSLTMEIPDADKSKEDHKATSDLRAQDFQNAEDEIRAEDSFLAGKLDEQPNSEVLEDVNKPKCTEPSSESNKIGDKSPCCKLEFDTSEKAFVSESVIHTHTAITESEYNKIENKHLSAVATDVTPKENQCLGEREASEIPQNEVPNKQITEEVEAANTSQPISHSLQGDKRKPEKCLMEENSRKSETTVNGIQNEKLPAKTEPYTKNHGDETNSESSTRKVTTLKNEEMGSPRGFIEDKKIIQDMHKFEDTIPAANEKQTVTEAHVSESPQTAVPSGNAGDIISEAKEIKGESTMDASLLDFPKKSRKDTPQEAERVPTETETTTNVGEVHTRELETIQLKEVKRHEVEGDENKTAESSPDAPVMVEISKDMDVDGAHKKPHNILSGVGSKFKRSISMVKKAIVCHHPEPMSPR